MDKVRVLRILEYVGNRKWVEEALKKAQIPVNGIQEFGDNCIKSALVDGFPERLDGMAEGDRKVDKILADENMRKEDTKMTYVELHRKLWGWLAENPNKNKKDWPGWIYNGGTTQQVNNDCFLCEYTLLHGCTCNGCILEWPNGDVCSSWRGLFHAWSDALDDPIRRSELAAQIRDLPMK